MEKKRLSTYSLLKLVLHFDNDRYIPSSRDTEEKNVTIKKYQNQHQCSIRRIPIYSESYQQGRQNSSGDLLGAMILGGIFGHAFSGNNDGAAAGAVLGALIQNDNANNSSDNGKYY